MEVKTALMAVARGVRPATQATATRLITRAFHQILTFFAVLQVLELHIELQKHAVHIFLSVG